MRRVHHLRVELHAVEARCRRRRWPRTARLRIRRDGAEAGRQRRHPVAVAHPHRSRAALRPDAVEQRALAVTSTHGAAELPVVARARPGRRAARPSSAGRSRCRAPARPRSNTAGSGARRVGLGSTEAGPPERMIPAGVEAARIAVDLVQRMDLAVDAEPRAPAGRSAASPGCRNRG